MFGDTLCNRLLIRKRRDKRKRVLWRDGETKKRRGRGKKAQRGYKEKTSEKELQGKDQDRKGKMNPGREGPTKGRNG